MKKILSVSILAMLAVAPLAANAAAGDQTATEITAKVLDSTAKVATTSYVQGAYNAIATQHNKIVDDITVSGVTGEGNHIGNDKSVAENLKTLNQAIKTIESTSVGAKVGGDYIQANNTVAQDLKALDTAIGTVNTGNYIVQSVASAGNDTTQDMGQNVQALDTAIGSMANFGSQNYATSTSSVAANLTLLDSRAKTNADAIALINDDDETEGSIAYAVKAETDRATGVEGSLSNLTSTEGSVLAPSAARTNLVSAINAVAAKVDTSATNATVNNGTYIGSNHDAGTVSAALSALDTQVAKNANNLGATGENGGLDLTTAATDVEGAINELDGDIGDKANLTVSSANRTNLVAAVNEVNSKVLTVYTDWEDGTGTAEVEFNLPTQIGG